MPTKHTWTFKPRLRARAFGWDGSRLACQRLKEAVAEIKKMARTDAVTAGDGVVSLMEKIWPAFEGIDTSSGAVGSAVNWTQDELLPIVINAPADPKTRGKWLKRLWQAIQDDGVSYLSIVEDRWGELCGSPEVASGWADELLELLRSARAESYVHGTSACLSSLLAAGRGQDLLEVLERQPFPFWRYRKFGVQVLEAEGRIKEALDYAESSRGLSQPNSVIDAECERILLSAGRTGEAYEKYALTANESSTGLATFRAIARKYPDRDPKQVLLDLAASSGNPGRWFAAAKDAGFLDLAREFARAGRTDPRTLSRASRDLLDTDAAFCVEVGRLAIARILAGHGYELTDADVTDAYNHLMAAAQRLGIAAQTRDQVLAIATKANQSDAAFSDTLIRQCSPDAPVRAIPVQARPARRRPRTKRRSTR